MGRREYLIALAAALAVVSCYGSDAAPDPTCLDAGGGKPIAIPNDDAFVVSDIGGDARIRIR